MTAPVEYKTLKVSPDIHRRIHSIAAKLETSADGAIAFLLGANTCRIPLTPTEEERWKEAAQAQGLTMPEFAKLRVEAALSLGCDPGLLHHNIERIGRTVDALGHMAGVRPEDVQPRRARSTPGTPPAPRQDTGGIPPR